MENKEAIEALKLINLSRVHPFYSWEEMKDVRDVAISALEKQIPKKPDIKITNRGIDISGEYDIDSDYVCSVCGCVVGNCETEDHWFEYCPNCGQALDWSDN